MSRSGLRTTHRPVWTPRASIPGTRRGPGPIAEALGFGGVCLRATSAPVREPDGTLVQATLTFSARLAVLWRGAVPVERAGRGSAGWAVLVGGGLARLGRVVEAPPAGPVAGSEWLAGVFGAPAWWASSDTLAYPDAAGPFAGVIRPSRVLSWWQVSLVATGQGVIGFGGDAVGALADIGEGALGLLGADPSRLVLAGFEAGRLDASVVRAAR